MSDDRPNPLQEVASKVGAAWSALAGLVGALAAFGVLSTAQADAVVAAGQGAPTLLLALGTVVAGVTGVVSGLVAAFHTAKAGRDHVTPVVSPRDNQGNVLVPQR